MYPASQYPPVPSATLPPHSHEGTVAPSSYCAWNSRPAASRVFCSLHRSTPWIRAVSAAWKAALKPIAVCPKSRQVSCATPSMKVFWLYQYLISEAPVRLCAGGDSGVGPSDFR